MIFFFTKPTDLDAQFAGRPRRYYEVHLAQAVAKGLVDERSVDVAATRVLAHQIKLGLFDAKTPFSSLDLSEVGAPQHAALALEAALQSAVLLQNPGNLLPISPTSRIAFLGPHANSTLDLLGNDYMKDNQAVLRESALDAATRRGLKVSYTPGCADLGCASTEGIAAAIASAESADVAVVFLGLSEQFENEGHDRTSLELPGHQMDLALAVLKAQPQTVVVLVHGGMV